MTTTGPLVTNGDTCPVRVTVPLKNETPELKSDTPTESEPPAITAGAPETDTRRKKSGGGGRT